ncbi:MAG: hypothetical protein WC812_03685 [Candidatus Pacearchaeota archaeon]|jgi:hypothetical protein
MFETFVTLAFYSSYGGGAIGNLFFQWQQAGVFSYVLPFLLIFALVFGILSTINIFGTNSKGISAIIAVAVGLMALQFDFVPTFFAEIFPRLGVGLAIILGFIILFGLFAWTKQGNETAMARWFRGMMIVVVLATVVIVVLSSLGNSYSWYGGNNAWSWVRYNWPTVLGVVLFLGAIIGILAGTGRKNPTEPRFSLTRHD